MKGCREKKLYMQIKATVPSSRVALHILCRSLTYSSANYTKRLVGSLLTLFHWSLEREAIVIAEASGGI